MFKMEGQGKEMRERRYAVVFVEPAVDIRKGPTAVEGSLEGDVLYCLYFSF